MLALALYHMLLKGEGRVRGPLSYVRKGDLVVAMYDNQIRTESSQYKLAYFLVNGKSTGEVLWTQGNEMKMGTREEFWASIRT